MTKFYTPCFLPFLHPEQIQTVKSRIAQNKGKTATVVGVGIGRTAIELRKATASLDELEKTCLRGWMPMLSPDNRVIHSILRYAALSFG